MSGRKTEIRPPKFLVDLYSDLRDQRLLPLVILLLVAIPAVPLILRDPTPAFVPPADGEGISAVVADRSLMVVSAPAGLRRHGERFADRSPRDPFVDPNARPARETAGGGTGNATRVPSAPVGSDPDIPGSDGDPAGRLPGIPSSPVSPPRDPGSSGGKSEPRPELRLFRHKTTVRFGRAGSGLLHTFEDIRPMRGLPKIQPIAVFIGASDDGSRAVFSISADAALVSGPGTCSSGRPKDCQFLSLRPGKGVSIVDARRGVVWRLAVTSIELIETDVRPGGRGVGANPGGQGGAGTRPGADPIDPDVVRAASLSEVIGLYLLK